MIKINKNKMIKEIMKLADEYVKAGYGMAQKRDQV